ncbi:MAG: TonB-dependent receptor [Bacteroidales bacterium]|nr:TonB-dependent receptor [Bacteroidales bacterium]
MKKRIALIVLSFISVMAWAQEISLSLHDATLEDFVKAVQEKTQYTFVYGQDIVLKSNVNIDVKNASLDDILSRLLTPRGIAYSIKGQHVTLTKKGGADIQNGSKTFTLSGYVKDSSSRETLIGATVYSTETHKGAVTNAYGFFSLTLPEGIGNIVCSYIGYEQQKHSINLKEDLMMTFDLVADNKIEEVVVEADRPETGTASSRTGAMTIPVEMISKQPSLLGEPDVLKAIQSMPGVQRGMAGTSGVHVRGGSPDQNLYLLDGVPMYNIDHVLGFMSAFTPDAVKHVDFYKASFPARYGGRLSSVIDVRTKDGDMHSYHGMAQIGTLSSHLSIEGPIKEDRTSFIVSARRSYFDLIAAPIMKAQEPDISMFKLNFYDINAKVNHIFSDRDRIYASFYMGRDVLGTGEKSKEKNRFDEFENESKSLFETDMRWGNTLGSLRWNHIFNPKLFSNATLAFNRFNFSVKIEDMTSTSYTSLGYYDENNIFHKHEQPYTTAETTRFKSDINSGIDDLTGIMDFDYHPTSHHHVKFGGQYIFHNFRPNISTSNSYSSNNDTTVNDKFKNHDNKAIGNEFDLYADDDMSIGDKWQMSAGIHATLFAVKGKMYRSLEPRLSAAYQIARGWRVKGSYAMMHQYVHLLQSAPISLPSNLWVPIDKNVKPMVSNLFSIGASSSALSGWEFTLEAYYKEMRHILDYKDGEEFSGSNRNWQELVAEGRGRSRGIELSARRIVGKTTGAVSYTISKTDRKFGHRINAGKWFPYKFDRRHTADIIVMHKINDRIDVAATWNIMSGSYETVAKQRIMLPMPQNNIYSRYADTQHISYDEYDYFDSRNNYRLKPSHQLDLSVNFHKQLKHFSRTINVSIINAYNHHNQDMVRAERERKHREEPMAEDDPNYIVGGTDNYTVVDEGYKTTLYQTSIIPIMPSISYTLHF